VLRATLATRRNLAVLVCALILLAPLRGVSEAGRPTRASSKPAKKSTAKKATTPKKAAAHSARTTTRSGSAGLGRDSSGPLTPDEALAEKLEKLWEDPALRQGTTAVYVVDSVTGDPVYAIHPDDPLNPASNVKLVSTAAALHVLGPEHRFKTKVLGPVADGDGAITGDIYLLGSYDPTLAAADVAALAKQLVAEGITRIDGDLIVGDGATRDGIYHAEVTIKVSAGAAPGDAPTVRVTPANALVSVDVTADTVKNKGGKTAKARAKASKPSLTLKAAMETPEGGAPRYRVTISGKMPVGSSATYERTVPERGLLTAHVLRQALVDAGIEIDGRVRKATLEYFLAAARTKKYLPVELAVHRSQPLSSIVAKINKRSINWLADRLIMIAGAALVGGDPSMEKGVTAMKQWLAASAGIDENAVELDTGSGLSYKTQLSARQIVDVLRAGGGLGLKQDLGDAAAARAYLDSLSIGGVDGTLRGRFKQSQVKGKIRGKTGTLTRILALSGVLPGATDTTGLAFAIVTNGHVQKYKSRVRKVHEQMVELLAEYLANRSAATTATATAARPPAKPAPAAALEAVDAEADTDDEEAGEYVPEYETASDMKGL
jgi:D-alanyl-D-alanine carboxypeptidase/D-alanyl-D-alanine-endopeptidase (penicillin-binding protein 4)